ncbi:MAG: SRPBCC domain-containing protein [Archangium sp.]
MTTIRVVREYPHPPSKVWRVLTVPELMALWGMRPEGFAPVVGTRFKLVAKPQPGWRGFVECEVLAADAPSLLRISWVGNLGQAPMTVTYRVEASDIGSRLTFEHEGFSGIGGFLLAKLMMGPGWKKMIGKAIPAVLDDLDESGALKKSSALTPKFA